ncbi:MAG TPA: hypothetical protein VMN78_06060 [Longimicrobiales bacterium]|nr:hypothetical protein [Longimicrobiales bacterium]
MTRRPPLVPLVPLALLALVASLASTGAVVAQQSPRVAAGALYRGFTLDPSLAATRASLLLVPVAADFPIGGSFGLELYGAFASGSIERGAETLELSGPVNANARAVWSARPWARVSLGVSIPTGDAGRDAEEAQVAAILSTDLLGFREASFGTGTAVTTGVAFAHQVGEWAVGWGASYRLAQEFEPLADSALAFAPGSQVVLRVAGDRNVGPGGKLTIGASYQHFADDEFASNLFRPGPRIRADAAYVLRTGPASAWSFFVTDIWRQQSDATLGAGADAADTTAAGSQNVVVAGAAGTLRAGTVHLLPRADVRLLSREDGTASGWLASAGLGVPVRLGRIEAIPRAQVMLGAIEAASGDRPGISGFEVELTLRWGGGR